MYCFHWSTGVLPLKHKKYNYDTIRELQLGTYLVIFSNFLITIVGFLSSACKRPQLIVCTISHRNNCLSGTWRNVLVCFHITTETRRSRRGCRLLWRPNAACFRKGSGCERRIIKQQSQNHSTIHCSVLSWRYPSNMWHVSQKQGGCFCVTYSCTRAQTYIHTHTQYKKSYPSSDPSSFRVNDMN